MKVALANVSPRDTGAISRCRRSGLAVVAAGCRRRADGIGRWRTRRQTKLERARLVLLPYLWLAMFFLAPFVIVLKISLSQTALAQPPYLPVLDLAAGWAGLKDFAAQLSADSFRLLASDSIYLLSYLKSLQVAAVSTAILLLIGYPVAYGIARAPRGWQPLAGDGGYVAVLDLVSDPRLCLDQYSAARRIAQRVLLAFARRSTRRSPGCRPTPRSISAWSIPICRLWCCRSTPRSKKWTRACWKPPPISAARAGKLLAGDVAAVAAGRRGRARCFVSSRSSANSLSPTCSAARRA